MRTETHGPSSPDFKRVFAAFSKIDEEARMVFGYATTETRDQQGEIVRLTAVKEALPEYMQFGNIREMHQPWAVGVAVEADVDGVGFWLGAHVVDDDAWKKVKAKVYKGFSIGGRVTERDTVDRTVITGLELTEVSVVDRPANPDAVFTVVKRGSDGKLSEQPLQKWDCGVAGHQHRAKAEASTCMEGRALDLQKKATAVSKAAVTLHAAADAATAAVPVETVEKATDHASGRFASHANLARGATKSRAGHERAAAKARDEERAHRAASARALKAGDTEGVTRHEQLASATASLAHTHDRAAEHYRDLAARHEAATTKEVSMPPEVTTAMTKAEEEASAALAALGKVFEPVEKKEIDHDAESKKQREEALDHTKSATQHEESGATSRADGREARKGGMTDRSDEHEAEADQHDLAAAGHHEVAETLHDLHGHHLGKAVGAEGADHAGIAARAHTVGQEHAARAHAHETKVTMHSNFAKADGLSKGTAAHHAEMAGKYAGFAAKAKKSASVMAGVHEAASKAVAEKVAKSAKEEAARAAKVTPVSGLKTTPDGWVDVSGTSFFGKRERDDAARQDLALKGFAMEDGAFPILDAAELADAVAAIGKAVDADAVKKHIAARAKALDAVASLPAELQEIGKAVADPVKRDLASVKTPESGATPAGAASEAERQAAGVAVGLDAGTKGVEKGAAIDSTVTTVAEVKTPASGSKPEGAATEAERQRAGVQKTAERVGKGMGIIAELAHTIARLESLAQSSEMEQLYEGDKACPVPAAIEALRDKACEVLRLAVEHETAEVGEGSDVDAYAAAAKAAAVKGNTISGIARLAKSVRDGAVEKTVPDVKKRAALKRLADSLDKAAVAAIAEAVKAAEPTTKVVGRTEEEVAKAVADAVEKARGEEQARAAKVIQSITGAVAGMTKQAGEMRAELEAVKKKVAKLEDAPLPAKGRPAGEVKLHKTDDPNGEDAIAKISQLPPAERAHALIAEAESARAAETSAREKRRGA